MQAIFATAVKQGCSRVEWHADVANEAARAFYAELGAPEFTGKVLYRLQGGSLLQAVIQARL